MRVNDRRPIRKKNGLRYAFFAILITLTTLLVGIPVWWWLGTQLYTEAVTRIDSASALPKSREVDSQANIQKPQWAVTATKASALLGWIQERIAVKESDLESRGQFGDMFGAASALFGAISAVLATVSAILVIVTIREQQEQFAHQSDREDRRDRNERDRLLLEISQGFWTLEMYEQRSKAFLLIEMLKPALGMSFQLKNASGAEIVVDDFVKPRSEIVLSRLVEWYVVGTSDDWNQLSEAMGKMEHAWDLDQPYEPSVDDIKAYACMARGLGHVLYTFGVHASILLSDDKLPSTLPPLTDYMGNQWTFWGGTLIPFLDKCKTRRSELNLENALWDRWLPEYHDYYRKAGKYSVINASA